MADRSSNSGRSGAAGSVVDAAARAAVAPLSEEVTRDAPLVLCAHAHCVRAVGEFARRVQDPAGRVRASHSIDLEVSRLLSDGKRSGGWDGPFLALVTPEHGCWQALRWAIGAVASRRAPVAVVCELHPTSPQSSELDASAVAVTVGDLGLPDSAGVHPGWPDLAPSRWALAEAARHFTAAAGEACVADVCLGQVVSRRAEGRKS